ncbi:MAG: tRNA CCA-pyrophosphorylase [Candidatus Pacearchaeota archaeon]|nr:MAG: tRNA CCA-pyrophosphorylase [Candidatus Pacearchaeota archaeon]
MKKKYEKILNEAILKVIPLDETYEKINEEVKNFISLLKNKIEGENINADVFIGGSFAKKTLIKKDVYEVDIFVRFFGYKENEISLILERIVKKTKLPYKKIKGSRDYFRIEIKKWLFFEVIPVKKISKPEEAENITDLSYFHVNYIKRNLNEKNLKDVALAKAFCYSVGCYGAESYIKGFSGYALELLIMHYKGFLNFLRKISKIDIKNKEIIDIERHYKTKEQILINLNSAKLKSPIILVDPTYKNRNVLAALSEETFLRFKKACKEFLKKPSLRFFEKKSLNIEEIRKKAIKTKSELLLLEIETNKQEGDIAGSKLLKFYNFLRRELSKFFEIKESYFEYLQNKKAFAIFILKNKKEILFIGPKENDKRNSEKFKIKHKNFFIKNGRFYSKEKFNEKPKDFLKNWLNKKNNKKTMKEMSIEKVKIINNF